MRGIAADIRAAVAEPVGHQPPPDPVFLRDHLVAEVRPDAEDGADRPVAVDRIELGLADVPSSIALIKDGRLKALAVSSVKRYPLLPDVPTFAEAGLEGFESIGWFGVVAPAGTQPEIVAKLNEAVVAALQDREVRARVLAVGADPAPSTPAEFSAFIRAEIAKWAKVVADTGAKAN